MNDEIKEILDDLLFTTTLPNVSIKLNKEKLNQLKDYITNLQEENERLKRDIEAMKHNYNLLVRCIENGESMTQKFENGLNYQDYKSRNKKAIEKLERIRIIGLRSGKTLFSTLINETIDILNGGDEE